MSNDGYEVVPESLRHAQQTFDDARERFQHLALNETPQWQLGAFDLGLLGGRSGVVAEYNAALNHVRDKLRESSARFGEISAALNTTAKIYEAQDEKYYEQFGWLAQDANSPYQPK
ncbi:MAG TPA: hypothetical protein VL652_29755 [Kutzneria sp.]|jgi:hypothetical protein|nr:hypothetical protein [Kutzneria sp.]